jgi:DNA-binding CsgD family transcriptional regulator
MELLALSEAVEALESPDVDEHPLGSDSFAAALQALIPCEGASLLDLDVAERSSEQVEVVPWPSDGEEDDEQFWQHFWSSAPCSYTERDDPLSKAPCATTDFHTRAEWHATGMYVDVFRPSGVEWDLVLPLPGRSGTSRRLVLFREPGRPFAERDKALARLLRPHLVEALRSHERARAVESLTARQLELLRLCALGLDNCRMARTLGISQDTVRKHLENAFAKLQVSSRSQAVAAMLPDLSWA